MAVKGKYVPGNRSPDDKPKGESNASRRVGEGASFVGKEMQSNAGFEDEADACPSGSGKTVSISRIFGSKIIFTSGRRRKLVGA